MHGRDGSLLPHGREVVENVDVERAKEFDALGDARRELFGR
jgi:hypothetical protein